MKFTQVLSDEVFEALANYAKDRGIEGVSELIRANVVPDWLVMKKISLELKRK